MNEPQLTELLSETGEAAIIIDDQGCICFANETAAQWLGFDRRSIVGRRCWEVIDGLKEQGARVCMENCEVMQTCRRTSKIAPFDLFAIKADGSRQWLNTSTLVVPSDNEGRFYLVHVWRDVAQRKEIEILMGEIMERLALLQTQNHSTNSSMNKQPSSGHPILTGQERNVLRLLSKGCDTAAVARELSISTTTVRNHIQHLLKRLQVHSRLEAIQTAARLGIL